MSRDRVAGEMVDSTFLRSGTRVSCTIAISDSWGERFAERWMYAGTAVKISQGMMNYLSW